MKKSMGISRRRFMTQAAAVAGFPLIIPARALGLDGAVAPSNRIVMGAIGVGGQGSYNMRQFLQEKERVQIVAVCDVDRSRRERAKQTVNEANGNQDCAEYNDFRELIARADIDAVCIGTPDHNHAIVAVAAAKAGKDMYCEKPLANSIGEARAIVTAVNRYKRVLQTGSHERSRDKARYGCELVRNGRIGKLHTIQVNLPKDNYGPPGPHPPMPIPEGFDYDLWLGACPYEPYTEKRCHFFFRYILDYSGGEITDRGAHIIDLAELGAGVENTIPAEFWGEGTFPRDDLYNTATDYHFEFTYTSGIKLIGTAEQPRGIKFIGSDGWLFIHIHGGDLEASNPAILKEIIGPNEIHLGRSPGHHADFINSVINRSVPMAPAEVGFRTATMCHLTNIAMLTGAKCKWDAATDTITNNDAANNMVVRTLRAPWRI